MIEGPTNRSADRLYDLLPVIYRQRDEEVGWPLKSLLRVVSEQVEVVERDIERLYEDLFIETCQDWVVPYIGDLVAYEPGYEAGEPTEADTPRARERNRILIPRREVANTVRYRRRKGTLYVLELLAKDVTGWPARAVEFYKLLAFTQAVNHPRPERGRTVDLRRRAALGRLGSPFEELSHAIDVRRIDSQHSRGWYNHPNVGLFVWRHRNYSVTETPAAPAPTGTPKPRFRASPIVRRLAWKNNIDLSRVEGSGPRGRIVLRDISSGHHRYTFSVLGNDTPLHRKPVPEVKPTDIAGETNLPVPIRRMADLDELYGAGRSLYIRDEDSQRLILPNKILLTDLSDWNYTVPDGMPEDTVALDPELGRIDCNQDRPRGLRVFYHYGFSADVGGGEYRRPVQWPSSDSTSGKDHALYRVGEDAEHTSIGAALKRWKDEKPRSAVIEIVDSGVYSERLDISLGTEQTLYLRAANRTRPVIRLPDYLPGDVDRLRVSGGRGSRFGIDGLLIAGNAVLAEGRLAGLTVRHCTLVPGWRLLRDDGEERPAGPSLQLRYTPDLRVVVENSILGPIQVVQDRVGTDPVRISLADSILDAQSGEALYAPGGRVAHASLTVERCTVLGDVRVHAIDLAENSIFEGTIRVGRRQVGCMRFCSLAMRPKSRTPRRFECQPDLAEEALRETPEWRNSSGREAIERGERERVRPRFDSVLYGEPGYCRLSEDCAVEVRRGADGSEIGVFHDLFLPQREANLRVRLDEYTPAGTEAGIIFAS